MELMMRYLMGRGLSGRKAREDFKSDVRAGLLVAFAFFFANAASQLKAEPTAAALVAIRSHLSRFGAAIDEWDCAECVGSEGIEKAQKKKRPYMKKSKRRTSPTKDAKTAKETNDATSAKDRSKSPAPRQAKGHARSLRKRCHWRKAEDSRKAEGSVEVIIV